MSRCQMLEPLSRLLRKNKRAPAASALQSKHPNRLSNMLLSPKKKKDEQFHHKD